MEQIWITGAGIISSIGIGKEETCRSLLEERSGIGELKYLKTEHHEFPVGEVKLTDDEMCQRLNIDKSVPMTRTALMGMLALQEAIADAGLKKDDLKNVGIVSGTTVGGMDKSELYYLDFLENDTRNEYIRTHDCGACTEMIADHFGRFAFVTTISTACSSAANAIVLGADMIRNGEAECVIVGGSECITKFHLNGFNSLMILDKENCRPFDATRAGLNLGEGAAFIVLESESHAHRRNCKAKAVLAGYANACDAFHQTASSPDGEGAYRAMKEALELAGLSPADVDYINAHGTGTTNNDLSESQAMKRLFGQHVPPMSSTKPFTGHTTSASGSIEAVFCILALQQGFLPVNLNWSQPIEDGIIPVSQPTKKELKHVLCNAFGFGGNDSSLLISSAKVPEPIEGPTKKNGASTGSATCYVLSAKQVSLQQPLSEAWMDEPMMYNEPYSRSIDPNFKEYVSPIEARRMGKILKRALATSKEALNASGLETVDAIITGTGYGCIENTEFFLDALSKEGEQLLKPTYFMQSTHNTISSLVAIQTQNHGYNATYAHKNISFDSALLDAWLQFRLVKIDSALVGGHDEMTPTFHQILRRGGVMGLDDELCGETAVSVVLSREGSTHRQTGPQPLCRLTGFKLLHEPTMDDLKSALAALLQEAGRSLSDMDFILTGISGNHKGDAAYHTECKTLFGDKPLLRYKHLFGESFTASGIGFYVAAQCLSKGHVPAALFVNPTEVTDKVPKTIVLFNRADGTNASLILLEA